MLESNLADFEEKIKQENKEKLNMNNRSNMMAINKEIKFQKGWKKKFKKNYYSIQGGTSCSKLM